MNPLARKFAALFAASMLLLNQEAWSFAPPLRNHATRKINTFRPHELCSTTPSSNTFLKQKSVPSSTSAIRKTAPLAAMDPSILIGSAVVHVVGGSISAPFVIDAVKTWYARIPLPSWTPPNRILSPVWTILYATIGVAAARIASVAKGGWKSLPLLLWALHYVLNLTWAPLFFGKQKLRASLIINCLLVSSMPFLIALYASLDKTAALLLVPYTSWLVFATILNQAICKLNPMDGKGYSNAMLQADIVKLQKEAAKYAGV